MADKQFTQKQEIFLAVLFEGEEPGNFQQAKKAAGYSDNVNMNQIIAPLKDEIIERTKEYLAANSAAAAISMVSVMNEPNQLGSNIKLNAAEKILDRVGVIKEEKMEVKSDGNIIFYLPPKETKDDKKDTEGDSD